MQKSAKGQKKKLDAVFSEYIRRRHADSNGYTQCVTCGRKGHWKEMDAGHFIGRRYNATRFDEMNVWPQCKSCNRFRNGAPEEYSVFLLKKYGEQEFHKLVQKKQKISKWSQKDYENAIETYKEKLANLGKDQCPFCCDWYTSVSRHQTQSECG